MFSSCYAEISITRKEPDQTFDSEDAAKQVARRFAELATSIITKSILKAPADPNKISKAENKIRKAVEFDVRMGHIKGFMELWNKWRGFYLDLPPIHLKNSGQITTIEKAIDFCEAHGFRLTMMIAAIHKAHAKRTMRPNFNMIVLYGEEHYDSLYDDVIADIDRADHERKCLERE